MAFGSPEKICKNEKNLGYITWLKKASKKIIRRTGKNLNEDSPSIVRRKHRGWSD